MFTLLIYTYIYTYIYKYVRIHVYIYIFCLYVSLLYIKRTHQYTKIYMRVPVLVSVRICVTIYTERFLKTKDLVVYQYFTENFSLRPIYAGSCTLPPPIYHGKYVTKYQFVNGIKAGLNSEFYFSYIGYLTKTKKPNLSRYSLEGSRRKIDFTHRTEEVRQK